MRNKIYWIVILLFCTVKVAMAQPVRMMYADTSRIGVPYAKDPHVVYFDGRYLMYYSIPPRQGDSAPIEYSDCPVYPQYSGQNG